MSENATSPLPPVVVDLGKVKRKRVKQLKRGRGRLVSEIDDVVEHVRRQLGEEAEDKQILPVVLLYHSPRRKRRRLFDW